MKHAFVLSAFLVFIVAMPMTTHGQDKDFDVNTKDNKSTSTFTAPSGWANYTSDKCKVSFSYPSNWTLSEKKGRFDTNVSGVVNVYPSFDVKLPAFNLNQCDELPNTNTTNADSESIGGLLNLESFGRLFELAITSRSSGYPYSSSLDLTIVESSHVMPDLVDNEDAAVITAIGEYKNKESPIPNVGTEIYIVFRDNKVLYSFIYADLPDRFDSPESKAIRDGILESVKFLN